MMDTFVYDEHNGHTFEAWFDRYSGVIEVGAANLGDKGKIELILMKLDPSANSLYRQAIAPKAPGEFSFTDTITNLRSSRLSTSRSSSLSWACKTRTTGLSARAC